MGFAISQLTAQQLQNRQSDYEYQLTLITNTLQRLANEEADITMKQMAVGQAYIAANTDEEGVPDEAAIEWVNSQAFNAQFTAKLKEIQAKEQQLDIQKQQIETAQKMASTQVEGWEKNTQSNKEKTFKYGN